MPCSEGATKEVETALEDPVGGPTVHVDRARRYPIQAPIHYRHKDRQEWHEGVAVNISRTGILFRIDSDILPETRVEIHIMLSGEVAGETPASVFCMGTVLRREFSASCDGRIDVAASISHYRFRQEGGGAAHLPTRWRSVLPPT